MINATVNADDNVLATGTVTLLPSASVEETTGNIDMNIVQGKGFDGTKKGPKNAKGAKSQKGAKSSKKGKKGGQNYCPSSCMKSIFVAKLCYYVYYNKCMEHYNWCGTSGGGGESYGGYRNLQENINKQDVTVGEKDDHLDASGVNETDSTNATKAASLGYDDGYMGKYCPSMCMSAIKEARDCKFYRPGCNAHLGWCKLPPVPDPAPLIPTLAATP